VNDNDVGQEEELENIDENDGDGRLS